MDDQGQVERVGGKESGERRGGKRERERERESVFLSVDDLIRKMGDN